jgi:hypothetical protein
MTMPEAELSYGEEVEISWGLAEVHGTVHEVYGPSARRHVVIMLTPEVSGDVVDEPTTVSMPIDSVKRVAPAA